MRDPADLDGVQRRNKLKIPREVQERLDREGKVARWIFDDADRLDQVKDLDWDPTPGVKHVASDGMNLVLHEKHADWWKDDQRAKQDAITKKDRLIREGQMTADGNDMRNDEFNRELARTNRISQRG